MRGNEETTIRKIFQHLQVVVQEKRPSVIVFANSKTYSLFELYGKELNCEIKYFGNEKNLFPETQNIKRKKVILVDLIPVVFGYTIFRKFCMLHNMKASRVYLFCGIIATHFPVEGTDKILLKIYNDVFSEEIIPFEKILKDFKSLEISRYANMENINALAEFIKKYDKYCSKTVFNDVFFILQEQHLSYQNSSTYLSKTNGILKNDQTIDALRKMGEIEFLDKYGNNFFLEDYTFSFPLTIGKKLGYIILDMYFIFFECGEFVETKRKLKKVFFEESNKLIAKQNFLDRLSTEYQVSADEIRKDFERIQILTYNNVYGKLEFLSRRYFVRNICSEPIFLRLQQELLKLAKKICS